MQELLLGLAAVTSFSAFAFVAVAVLWLRRLRESVSSALAESASQQIRTAQRLNDALAQVKKQQDDYDRQLQTLAQANSQLRQGLVDVVSRLDHGYGEIPGDRTLH